MTAKALGYPSTTALRAPSSRPHHPARDTTRPPIVGQFVRLCGNGGPDRVGSIASGAGFRAGVRGSSITSPIEKGGLSPRSHDHQARRCFVHDAVFGVALRFEVGGSVIVGHAHLGGQFAPFCAGFSKDALGKGRAHVAAREHVVGAERNKASLGDRHPFAHWADAAPRSLGAVAGCHAGTTIGQEPGIVMDGHVDRAVKAAAAILAGDFRNHAIGRTINPANVDRSAAAVNVAFDAEFAAGKRALQSGADQLGSFSAGKVSDVHLGNPLMAGVNPLGVASLCRITRAHATVILVRQKKVLHHEPRKKAPHDHRLPPQRRDGNDRPTWDAERTRGSGGAGQARRRW